MFTNNACMSVGRFNTTLLRSARVMQDRESESEREFRSIEFNKLLVDFQKGPKHVLAAASLKYSVPAVCEVEDASEREQSRGQT